MLEWLINGTKIVSRSYKDFKNRIKYKNTSGKIQDEPHGSVRASCENWRLTVCIAASGEGTSMMLADNFCLPGSPVMIQHYVWPGRKSDGLISRSLLKTGQDVTDVNMIFTMAILNSPQLESVSDRHQAVEIHEVHLFIIGSHEEPIFQCHLLLWQFLNLTVHHIHHDTVLQIQL